jgi:hypothetical protein
VKLVVQHKYQLDCRAANGVLCSNLEHAICGTCTRWVCNARYIQENLILQFNAHAIAGHVETQEVYVAMRTSILADEARNKIYFASVF